MIKSYILGIFGLFIVLCNACSSETDNPHLSDFETGGGSIQAGEVSSETDAVDPEFAVVDELSFARSEEVKVSIDVSNDIAISNATCQIDSAPEGFQLNSCVCNELSCEISLQPDPGFVGVADIAWSLGDIANGSFKIRVDEDLSDDDNSPAHGFAAGTSENHDYAGEQLMMISSAPKGLRSTPLSLNLQGLVAYWDFDGVVNTQINDGDEVKANGFNLPFIATNSGATVMEYRDGVEKTSVKFFEDSILQTAANDVFTIKNTAISLSAWVRVDPVGAAGGSRIISKPFDANTDDYALMVNTNEVRFRLHIADGAGGVILNVDSQTRLTPDTWHHIAGTYDGVSAKLFINGILVNAVNETRPLFESLSGVSVGDIVGQAATRSLDGRVDEISIWSRTLSHDEIKMLADRQTGDIAQFTSRIFDSSENEKSWDFFEWQRATPTGSPLPPVANPEANFAGFHADSNFFEDCVLEVLFDGAPYTNISAANDTIADLSGNNNAGSLDNNGGDLFYFPGKFSSAIDVVAARNTKINFGSDDTLDNIFAGGGTISMWVWLRSNNSAQLIQKGNGNAGISGYYLRVNNGGLEFYQDFVGAPEGRWRTDNNVLRHHDWNHITLTYDSNNSNNDPKIFVNGAELNLTTTTDPGAGQTADNDNDKDFVVANDPLNTRAMDGLLDELLVWKKLLDANTVQNIYKRGLGWQQIQLRTCAEADCSDTVFSNSSTDTTYSLLPAGVHQNNLVPALRGRFLQYRITGTTLDIGQFQPSFSKVDFNPESTEE